MDNTVVRITSLGGDDDDAVKYSEDLAWEHATMLANTVGMSLGSDRFVEVYDRLRERYRDCALSFGFLHNLAARTLKELMESGVAVTFKPGEGEGAVSAKFNELVAVIFTSMAWSYACGPEAWVPNDEWDEHTENERSIDFYVVKPTVKMEERDNDND